MEKLQRITELVAAINIDAEKFYGKKNSAAGTRLRNSLQELKVVSQEIRNDVTAVKNSQK